MSVRPVRPWLTAIAVAVALAGSACGSSETHAAPPPHFPPGHFPDLLSRELAQVAATPGTRSHAVFGQAHRIVQANGLSLAPSGPAAPLIALGWINLNASTIELSRTIGFQPELSDTALTAGDGANLAARLTGKFDADGIGVRLSALGGRLDHGTWRMRPDGEADITDPIGRKFPALTNQINLIHVTKNEVAYGPSAASIATMRATSRTLADDPAIRAVAACMDDPLAALLTDEGFKRDSRPGGYTLGMGVRGRVGGPDSEVLCRSARTPAEANRLAASYRRILTTGKAPGRKPIPTMDTPHQHFVEQSPYTEILHDIKVTARNDGTPTVRITARPGSWTGPTALSELWANSELTPLGP